MPNEGKPAGRMRGKLFVFEGPDGVGKTTLAGEIVAKLQKNGSEVLFLSFPGREPRTLGSLVYAIHHDSSVVGLNRVSPISLQILHIAAHIDCIENRIIPALTDGKTVVLDRYWWSTIAYGEATGIPCHVLKAMIELEDTAWGNVRPDIMFLITRKEPFRAELSNEKWSRICGAYLALANKEMTHYPVRLIENSKMLNKVSDKILSCIEMGLMKEDKKSECQQESIDLFSCMGKKRKRPISHWRPTQITEVFDTYWRFAAERQAIFFKQLKGEIGPLTEDHIIRDYKFTNAYRASDRVSQFLIRHVIYCGEQDPKEILFRILLFKTFNKIETWNLLLDELGHIVWNEFDFRFYDRIFTKALRDKKSIYSAAYIMPSGACSFGHQVKHRNHLHLIRKMMTDGLHARIMDATSMHEVFGLLRGYPMIGDFLAYQYAIDINYSPLTNFSEMSFVMPGPGAKDGLRKCFLDFGGLSEVDLIKLLAERQEAEFSRLEIDFQNLWGRQLQLIDCQNLLCEVDKYARIAHPEIKGLTGRSRIKQKYKVTPRRIDYFYPPKWNINERVQETLNGK